MGDAKHSSMSQAAASHPPDMRRQTYRLGSNYVLHAARLVAQALDRDMITALVFLAISRANVADFTETPEAATTFGGAQDIPPDDVRVPISVYRLSRELGLPYETTRRHVSDLKTLGLCLGIDGGWIVPSSAYERPSFIAAVEQNFSLTANLVVELASFGVTSNLRSTLPDRDVSRQTVRLSIDFFLDALCLMARVMELGFVDVLLLRSASLANVDVLVHSPELGAKFGGLAAIPSDAHRAPVTAYAIATFLMMPYETVRRRMNRLVSKGLMERWVHGGYVVPEAVVIRPEVVSGTAEFAALTQEFLERLSRIGVPARADLPALARFGGRAGAIRT